MVRSFHLFAERQVDYSLSNPHKNGYTHPSSNVLDSLPQEKTATPDSITALIKSL